MEVRNSQFTAYIDMFTGNTYIMVIMAGPGPKIPTTLTQLNIAAAKKHFEKFIPENA
jgi:Ras-related GTP-binding protein A/B